MKWKYTSANNETKLDEKSLDRIKAFLDSLFGVLGSFGAKLTGDHDFYAVSVYIDDLHLNWGDLEHGIDVETENGITLGRLELEVDER